MSKNNAANLMHRAMDHNGICRGICIESGGRPGRLQVVIDPELTQLDASRNPM
jgi:hypothetical protein